VRVKIPRLPRVDILMAVGVLAAAILEVSANANLAPKGAALASELAMAVAIAWRRAAPLTVTVVIAMLLVGETLAGVPLQEPVVPLLSLVLAVFTVAAYASLARATAGMAVVVTGDAIQTMSQHKGPGNFVFGLVFGVGTWLIGRLVRARTHENVVLHARAEQLAEDSAARAAEAVAAERARIARDLHDVISHSVSVMVVQAAAAEQITAIDVDRAREAMRIVQSTGRQALSELAHLLGMLREGGEEMGLAPQPGMSRVPELLSVLRAQGHDVDLRIEGPERPLPPGVALSVYRVVQEALTNVRKHAAGARCTVLLQYSGDAVEVEVADDGARSTSRVAVDGGGHGLIGMTERVGVYGGTLEAGPRAGGGYVVRAHLPVEASS
jgi:signal transduction histidine kinase